MNVQRHSNFAVQCLAVATVVGRIMSYLTSCSVLAPDEVEGLHSCLLVLGSGSGAGVLKTSRGSCFTRGDPLDSKACCNY
mgnify:CR=1 FL=1